jgi:CDP-diacylglycerol--glycerol-3-phosphate 3-phosphatidyltransferase
MIKGGNTNIRIATFIFFIGAVSDYFDGWLARNFNQESKLGKFLDPLADKFLTTAAFIIFYFLDIVPIWPIIIIIIRDFGTTFFRLFDKNNQIKTSYFAKLKTSFQMLFITYIMGLLYLQTYNLAFFEIVIDYEFLLNNTINVIIIILIAVMSVITLIDYFIDFFKSK